MALQLIFTSAPQGLRPGTRGFTTVAASPQLSTTLTSRLESLSGYAQAFNLSDAKAHLNPVNFAHVRLSLANENWNIVSRVAAAGVDYSGRSNTLAHHLVVAGNERPIAGPAWLAVESGVLRNEWTGAPQALAPAVLSNEAVTTRACPTWASLAGDAGWAGVLAWQFLEQPKRPVFLIYSPEQGESIPRLIVEASLLLPPARRWELTFSTYAPNLPPDVTCLWRGVLAGTPAAAAAKVARGALVVDLTMELEPPVSSPGVEAARSGIVIEVRQRAAKTAESQVSPGTTSILSASSEGSVGELEPQEYDLNHSDSNKRHASKRRVSETTSEPQPKAAYKIWVVASMIALVFLISLAGYFVIRYRVSPTQTAVISTTKPAELLASNPVAVNLESSETVVATRPSELALVQKYAPPISAPATNTQISEGAKGSPVELPPAGQSGENFEVRTETQRSSTPPLLSTQSAMPLNGESEVKIAATRPASMSIPEHNIDRPPKATTRWILKESLNEKPDKLPTEPLSIGKISSDELEWVINSQRFPLDQTFGLELRSGGILTPNQADVDFVIPNTSSTQVADKRLVNANYMNVPMTIVAEDLGNHEISLPSAYLVPIFS